MPDILWMDDDLTVAQAISAPIFEAPFRDLGINVEYILRQNFRQLKANKAPLALDTPHPDYPTFLLASEGPETDLGGLVVDWTRTYAKVPANFSRYDGTIPYVFPGYDTGLITTSRFPLPLTVATRIAYDFFHVDPATVDILQPQRYRLQVNGNDAISANVGSPVVTDAVGVILPTTPTQAAYKAMVVAGTEIIPQASDFKIWMGNIYLRKTIYIKAQ